MMYCPNGFQKDSNGCDMCKCAANPFNKPQTIPVKRPLTTWTRPKVIVHPTSLTFCTLIHFCCGKTRFFRFLDYQIPQPTFH